MSDTTHPEAAMELVVIGTPSFLPGFGLAGVRNLVPATPQSVLEEIKAYNDAGIIILDETLIANLGAREREQLEVSLHPVIIILAKDSAGQKQRLKRAIMNTLGVDLLK